MTSLHATRKLQDGTLVADLDDLVDQIQISETIKKNNTVTLEELPKLMKLAGEAWEIKSPSKISIEKLISILTKVKERM